MEMEYEETAVESCSSIATPCEALNRNDETIEDDTESEADETNQVQSNLFVVTEDSRNLINTETCLESSVTPNKTYFPTSSQPYVSLKHIYL